MHGGKGVYECEGVIDTGKQLFGRAKNFFFGGDSTIPTGDPTFSICPGCADSFDSATMPSSPTIAEFLAQGGGGMPPLFFGQTAPAGVPSLRPTAKKSFFESYGVLLGLGAIGFLLLSRRR